jgi:hypothetical protein
MPQYGYELGLGLTSRTMVFFMALSADGKTGATGKTVTATLSKNGAAFAAPQGSVAEISSGWYKLTPGVGDTGTLGPLALHATAADCDPTDAIFFVRDGDPNKSIGYETWNDPDFDTYFNSGSGSLPPAPARYLAKASAGGGGLWKDERFSDYLDGDLTGQIDWVESLTNPGEDSLVIASGVLTMPVATTSGNTKQITWPFDPNGEWDVTCDFTAIQPGARTATFIIEVGNGASGAHMLQIRLILQSNGTTALATIIHEDGTTASSATALSRDEEHRLTARRRGRTVTVFVDDVQWVTAEHSVSEIEVNYYGLEATQAAGSGDPAEFEWTRLTIEQAPGLDTVDIRDKTKVIKHAVQASES